MSPYCGHFSIKIDTPNFLELDEGYPFLILNIRIIVPSRNSLKEYTNLIIPRSPFNNSKSRLIAIREVHDENTLG